jgi:hypothetical protein
MAKNLSFGERHVILSLCKGVKYDGRTREGKLAHKIAQMRLATATDDELVDLAKHEFHLFGAQSCSVWQEIRQRLTERRETLRSGQL